MERLALLPLVGGALFLLPFAGVALVTDFDAGLEGVDGIEPVTQEEVFATFDADVVALRSLLLAVAARA